MVRTSGTECDTVVIFGLPYLPKTWAANVFMALQGSQPTEWLQDENSRRFRRHDDIRQALEWGQISTNVIQAINRVRCRRTIDDLGNCEPTDVFILLPKDKLADVLVRDIKAMMPGITIKSDWDYKPQKSKGRASNHEKALIKFIENMNAGRYAPTEDR